MGAHSAAQEVCGWIKAKANRPVWAKMTPNITDITQPARTALAAGCEGVAAINTITSGAACLGCAGSSAQPSLQSPTRLILGSFCHQARSSFSRWSTLLNEHETRQVCCWKIEGCSGCCAAVMGINLDTLRPEPCVEGYTTPGGYSSKAVKPIALAKVGPTFFPDRCIAHVLLMSPAYSDCPGPVFAAWLGRIRVSCECSCRPQFYSVTFEHSSPACVPGHGHLAADQGGV